MKEQIKKNLALILHPLITRLGYSKPSKEVSLLEQFLLLLKELDFAPKHIVDVGANHGTWTRAVLGHFPDAYYTLIEPQKWLETDIKDILDQNPKVKFHNYGAGSSPGSFKFTIADRDDSSNFRMTEEDAIKNGFKQVEIEIVTLNEFLPALKLPDPDLIKIDAEGLDLEVLKGASHFFGKTEIFMIEASVAVTEFKNSFLKIIQYMDQNGYQLFEITELNRPLEPKILCLTELAFIRKNGLIDAKKIV